MSSGDQEALDLADECANFDASIYRDVAHANAGMLAKLQDAADEIRRLVAERETDRRELANLRARLDRAIKAAEEHFGEDAIRYKLSLFKNGRASNYFPQEFDGKWFAFQRADDDAHIGLCDRINQLEAEREADRAVMRVALDVFGRCASGIDHLAEIARLWEPDHSSGADRRGWVLAQDAADDARAAISSLKARTQ